MAWPDNLDSIAINFPSDLLPYLKDAIDDDRVKWLGSSQFASATYAHFEYLGFQYAIEESYEIVTAIKKIAKIDEDEEGDTVVVEDYVEQAKRRQYQQWGDF